MIGLMLSAFPLQMKVESLWELMGLIVDDVTSTLEHLKC